MRRLVYSVFNNVQPLGAKSTRLGRGVGFWRIFNYPRVILGHFGQRTCIPHGSLWDILTRSNKQQFYNNSQAYFTHYYLFQKLKQIILSLLVGQHTFTALISALVNATVVASGLATVHACLSASFSTPTISSLLSGRI